MYLLCFSAFNLSSCLGFMGCNRSKYEWLKCNVQKKNPHMQCPRVSISLRRLESFSRDERLILLPSDWNFNCSPETSCWLRLICNRQKRERYQCHLDACSGWPGSSAMALSLFQCLLERLKIFLVVRMLCLFCLLSKSYFNSCLKQTFLSV